jgi:hypothetical protein
LYQQRIQICCFSSNQSHHHQAWEKPHTQSYVSYAWNKNKPCTYPSMNLDHETTSTVVIMRLYLAIAIETMP